MEDAFKLSGVLIALIAVVLVLFRGAIKGYISRTATEASFDARLASALAERDKTIALREETIAEKNDMIADLQNKLTERGNQIVEMAKLQATTLVSSIEQSRVEMREAIQRVYSTFEPKLAECERKHDECQDKLNQRDGAYELVLARLDTLTKAIGSVASANDPGRPNG